MVEADIHNSKLTGPEINSLWTQYQTDSLNLHINSYMYHHLEEENQDIKSIFKEAIKTSENNLNEIETMLKHRKVSNPTRIYRTRCTSRCPKLYSDALCLKFLHEMTIHGLSA